MIKKTYSIFLIVLLLGFFVLPTLSFAQGSTGLVPCTDNCAFKDLLTGVNNLISFILVYLAVPIAAIMFAYAGFLLVFSGGEPTKRTKAKDIFINVALGLVFVAACWLIVHTILGIVGYDTTWDTWFGL